MCVCVCERERERRERRKRQKEECVREKGKKEAKEEREGDING